MDGWTPAWPPIAPSEAPTLSGEIHTEAPEPADGQKKRASPRVPVALDAALRQRGTSGVTVQIVDLSTHGFRIETHLDLQEGADVWVRLPGIEPYHAKVAWVRGYVAGCAFERPLHPAVLELIVARARRA